MSLHTTSTINKSSEERRGRVIADQNQFIFRKSMTKMVEWIYLMKWLLSRKISSTSSFVSNPLKDHTGLPKYHGQSDLNKINWLMGEE
jgi:hypothetical protein